LKNYFENLPLIDKSRTFTENFNRALIFNVADINLRKFIANICDK